MFKNILTEGQLKLFPFIKLFSSDFFLVGGTAVALQLGHRRSIDFDLFTFSSFDPIRIRKKITRVKKIEHTLSQGEGELTVSIDQVKITFFHYPYLIERQVALEDIIRMPDLLTLGAMKAFTLGKRAKWKDYLDLYFLLQKFSLKELMAKSSRIFGSEFNEKLFRSQLGYFKDIDYSEKVVYLEGFKVGDREVKKFLEKVSLVE